VELMNMGANFMREHIPSDCRVHYAIVNAGGISPNVVQADADVLYTVRAPDPAQASALGKWLGEIAQGASLMTQTRLIMEFDRASSCLQPNHVIERRMNTVLEALGPVVFDDADLEYANRIRATLNPETIHSNIRLFHARDIPEGAPLHQSVLPFSGESHFRPSSTDVGDVSCVVPTAQCWCACWAIGTSGHTWQVVAQGKSRAAHKGMVHAAKVLSATALALIEDPSVIQEAKNELRHRMNGNRYVCPIPAEIAPPIDANSSTRSRAG